MFRDILDFQGGEGMGRLPRLGATRALVVGHVSEPSRTEFELSVVIPDSAGGVGLDLRMRGTAVDFQAQIGAIFEQPVDAGAILPALADLGRLEELVQETGTIVETVTGANYYDEAERFIEREIGQLSPDILRRSVEVKEVAPGLLHLIFPNQAILADTMLRFQEHYESPRFHSTVFTRDDFAAWYRTTQPHGGFSYHFDWPGFNVPARCFEPFQRGDFPALSVGERVVLEKLGAHPGVRMVIATFRGGDPDTFRHELAHGFFDMISEYRAEALRIIGRIDRTPLYRILESQGYAAHTWDDEIQAYLIGDRDELVSAEDSSSDLAAACDALRELFDRYRTLWADSA